MEVTHEFVASFTRIVRATINRLTLSALRNPLVSRSSLHKISRCRSVLRDWRDNWLFDLSFYSHALPLNCVVGNGLLWLPLFLFEHLHRLEVDQLQSISQQIRLHSGVCHSVHGQSGTGVDFKEPWFEELIDHDVEAHQLEAVLRVWTDHAEVQAREHDDALNLVPQFFEVVSETLYLVTQLFDGPLVVQDLLALLSRGAFVFVNTTVRQVRVHVAQLRVVIAISREASKAFLVEEEFERSHRRNGHINSHVPLHASNEEWFVDVLL